MKTKEYILILFSLLLFGNCVREDLTDCPRGKYLVFKTNSPKYRFEEVVNSVDVYLYDEGERLVSQYSFSQQQLAANNYRAYIPHQDNGDYMIVALVNQNEYYTTTGTSNLGELRTRLIVEDGDTIKFKPTDIYHSFKEVKFGDTYEVVHDTLTLSKNTNNIEVEVEIEGYTLSSNTSLQTYIIGSNTVYNYNNRAVAGPKVVYAPHTDLISNKVRSNNSITLNNLTTTMRLWIGDDLKLSLEEHKEGSSSVVIEDFMITKILSSMTDPNTGEKLYDTNEKLELEDEYKVKIILDNTLKVAEIIINDWYKVNPGVDL